MSLAALALVLAWAAPAGEAKAAFREAVRLSDAGQKAAALDLFRRAATLDPSYAEAHREMGLILLDQRDFAAAATAFRKVAELAPADLDSRYNLALALANAGRRAEGISELRRLTREKRSWALPYFGLGHVYALEQQKQSAEQAYRTALRLDPKLVRAHFELGKLLEEQGDREAAVAAFQEAVRAAPDYSPARYRLGVLLQQAGRPDQARQEFEAYRALRENRARGERAAAAFTQAVMSMERGEYEAAVRELSRAAELRPDFPEIRAALAEARELWGLEREQQGDVAGALEQFQEAVKLDPRADTENHIGVLLAKSGRLDEAVAAFRRALALDPAFANAARNLQQALAIAAGQR